MKQFGERHESLPFAFRLILLLRFKSNVCFVCFSHKKMGKIPFNNYIGVDYDKKEDL